MTDCAYPAFKKIPRFNREVVVTEKLDGTNALVSVEELTGQRIEHCMTVVDVSGDDWESNPTAYAVRAGSRHRWLSTEFDNFGFAQWVADNASELVELGPGLHYGEWYGRGIQRGYGLDERRFALFNTGRWYSSHRSTTNAHADVRSVAPDCCDVVPELWQGNMAELVGPQGRDSSELERLLWSLRAIGSEAVPGYERPEGIVIYHTQSRQNYKILLEGDDRPKGASA